MIANHSVNKGLDVTACLTTNVNLVIAEESCLVYAGKNSSKPLPEILKALTPSVSAFVNAVVDVTTLINALSALSAIACDADRSGSNSTSDQATEPVEKVPAASDI